MMKIYWKAYIQDERRMKRTVKKGKKRKGERERERETILNYRRDQD
jgi:hypothetical protein